MADVPNSAFVANVHHLLGRRFQLAKDPFNHSVSCSNSIVSSSNFSLSSSSPVSNASLLIYDSSLRRMSLAIGQCTLPRGATCRWPPNSTCAIVVCCHCCFRCVLTWSPAVLRADCFALRHDHVDRTTKHFSSAMKTSPSVERCFAITDVLSAWIARSTFSSCCDSTHSQPCGSDFILHPQVCHINVLQSTNPLTVDDVFSGLHINGQHWLHLVTLILQQRRNDRRNDDVFGFRFGKLHKELENHQPQA